MQTKVLSSKKELIKEVLSGKEPGRIASLYSDIDLYSEKTTKESDRFFQFDFNGPMQSLSSEIGLESALERFIQEPRQIASFFKKRLLEIIETYRDLKHQGCKFDGVWMWEDIAYDKGLYFSIEKYRNQLIGVHKDICDFFISEGVPIFFHCDGNVQNLIPLLVAIGVKAIHPMQEKVNPDLMKLKEIFKGVLTLIGGVGIDRLSQEKHKLLEYIENLKEGGNYIFSFDGPIPEDSDSKQVANLLDEIKDMEQGA